MSTGNIVGIGVDIIEIDRVQRSIDSHQEHFLKKVFTEEEIAYCSQFTPPYERFAGHFAAKEAIAKALGCGFGSFLSFLDISISHTESGSPLAKIPSQFSVEVLVSISHCKTYAVGFATAVKK